MSTHRKLPDRAALFEETQKELSRSSRNANGVGLVALDLSGLREINNWHGVAAGDAVLNVVIDRLVKSVRGYDFVARTGGDEFTILTPDMNHQDTLERFIQRLRSILEAPIHIPNVTIEPTFCFGATFHSKLSASDTTAEEALRRVHAAIGAAKKLGPGSVNWYDPEIDAAMRERRRLLHALKAAIANDEIEVAYQPIVDGETGEVRSVEALARWTHEGRPISPMVFIQIAEDHGLVARLGEAVLRKACTACQKWDGITVAVNVSPVQLQDSRFPTIVSAILSETGLEPERLELEITETVLVKDIDRATSMLGDLRALGINIALDDFGTGYSSLSYLAALPFSRLKIDRSFIASPKARDIVQAVLGLAHTLKMDVTAEGVETEEQRDFLTLHGCNHLQGYLFGRPSPEYVLDDIMAARPSMGMGM